MNLEIWEILDGICIFVTQFEWIILYYWLAGSNGFLHQSFNLVIKTRWKHCQCRPRINDYVPITLTCQWHSLLSNCDTCNQTTIASIICPYTYVRVYIYIVWTIEELKKKLKVTKIDLKVYIWSSNFI